MRKSLSVTIDDDGRDKGKVFLLTELPASQGEKWAARAFLAFANSGIDVPPDVVDSGLAGIASLGIKSLAGLKFTEAEPLLDEMMGCIQFQPDPKKQHFRQLVEDDIEEISTRIKLRSEVIKLHINFSMSANRSGQASIISPSDLRNIQTSRGR